MNDKRNYHIIIGSKAFFDSNLPLFDEDDDVHGFLELVKLSDAAKQNKVNIDFDTPILILKMIIITVSLMRRTIDLEVSLKN